MNKYLTELIGTFFLVLVIGLTGDPIAVGSILMAMVYVGGNISGAHFNPAVTLAVLLRGRIQSREAVLYMVYQLAGSFLAALLIWITYQVPMGAPSPAPGLNVVKPLLYEIIFTFALATVVLNVATTKKAEGNSYYGLAIGFTVMAGASVTGNLSGGAFNPAVALGPMLMDLFLGGSAITHIWIYLVGCFGGAALAAWAFKIMNPSEA